MFDNQKSLSPAVKKTDSLRVSAPGVAEEKIYTMPMEYYFGAGAKGAVKPMTIAQSSKTGQSNLPSNKKRLNFIIVIVLILVFAGSAWLLVKSFEKPLPAVQLDLTPPGGQQVSVSAPENNVPLDNNNTALETKEQIDVFNPSQINKFSLALLSGADFDRDELTDAEEAIFNANPKLADTDHDGYPDGHEVKNFYSPVDIGLIRLWEKDFVKEYKNLTYQYKLLYPSAWLVKAVSESNPTDVMILSEQNEFVNILVDSKKTDQTLVDWYLEKAPTVDQGKLKTYSTFYQLPVLESPDAFTAYIANGDIVYILNYNIGLKEEANYPFVFQMMVNSFQLTNAPAVSPAQAELVWPTTP